LSFGCGRGFFTRKLINFFFFFLDIYIVRIFYFFELWIKWLEDGIFGEPKFWMKLRFLNREYVIGILVNLTYGVHAWNLTVFFSIEGAGSSNSSERLRTWLFNLEFIQRGDRKSHNCITSAWMYRKDKVVGLVGRVEFGIKI